MEREAACWVKIVMLAGDDQADPKQAVSMANKYINQKAIAVVGHWNSTVLFRLQNIIMMPVL
jgi:ABC-type branched-subunit amino acid transport system substrate-binding protein